MLRQEIALALKKTLENLGLPVVEPNLEHPADEKNGDYSTNVAMVLYKRHAEFSSASVRIPETSSGQALKQVQDDGKVKSPLDLANAIAANFPQTEYLEKVEAVAPGFINFYLKPDYIYNSIDVYGKTDLLKGKKIMVEFAHPNTHKMFHIGHLRNITTGEAIVRLLQANGAKVIRANYQGDVGMHIAKCLWGILQKTEKNVCHPRESGDPGLVIASEAKSPQMRDPAEAGQSRHVEFLGEAYVLGAKAYETDPKAKKEIGEINKKIYQKDPEVIKLWQETRAWSLEYFDLIYKRVYTTFDRLYFESEVAERGKELVLQNVGTIFEKSDGAIIFPGEKFGSHTRVFINSEGNPTYEGKDMGLGELQFKEYNPDLLIHNLGPEQLGYTQVMFEALAQLFPETRGKEYHLAYGWVKLKSGKMSSRTGEVVLGEWLLDEAKKRLQEKFKMEEEIAEVVAVGAVKYSLLKVGLSSEIAFDIEESINLEGDSGPYLQYTYARTRSVLAKAKDLRLDTGNWKLDKQGFSTNKEVRSSKLDDQTSSLQPQNLASSVQRLVSEELSLLRTLYRFPEIVANAGILYSPNLLCGYLFGLAQKFNLFYNRCPILNATMKQCNNVTMNAEEVREFRLALTAATGQIIKNGLYLLGIKVMEKM